MNRSIIRREGGYRDPGLMDVESSSRSRRIQVGMWLERVKVEKGKERTSTMSWRSRL